MRTPSTEKLGGLLAAALAGCWRSRPPEPTVGAEELSRITTLLAQAGSGALAWWKLRESPLSKTEPGEALHLAYRAQTLHAAVYEQQVEQLFALLHSAGVDAVLVKGWATARAYPEQGLRPAGDIDLCVRPADYLRAKELLASTEGRRFWVDLHEGFGELIGRSAEDLFERTRLVGLGRSRVRVLCEEDQLRFLCLHLLKHGAWRPLWLCDVAAALEARGRDFDWGRLVGGERRLAGWVAVAVGLAHTLLGARVDDTPLACAAPRQPRWLARAVIRQWDRPYPHAHEAPPLMRTHLRRPSGAFGAVRRRWPDPIRATVYFKGPFNEFPRLPFQLGNFVGQGARYLLRLPAELRDAA